MFQFPGLPSHRLCIHLWILKHYLKCVPAFGNLRIIGYLLLPAAYRSLSRPSSAPSAKASALCSSSLDLLLVFCPLRCVATRILRYSHTLVCSVPRNSCALCYANFPAQFLCFRALAFAKSPAQFQYFVPWKLNKSIKSLFKTIGQVFDLYSKFQPYSFLVYDCISDIYLI